MKQNQRLYVVMNKESDFQKGHGFQVEISREGVQLREDALFGIYTTCVWDSREKEMTLYFPIDGFMLSAAFPASCCIFYGAISMI